MRFQITNPDPLRVLRSTLPVVLTSRHVRIDHESLASAAERIAHLRAEVPSWGDDLHFRDGSWRTAGWVLALDALNFCFWNQSPGLGSRWRVEYGGQSYDGYWALVAALRRAVDEGIELWEPDVLRGLSHSAVARLLRPELIGGPEIPLLELRHRNLVELGDGLTRFAAIYAAPFPGAHPVETFLASAGGSAVRLVEQVVEWFPSFRDVVDFRGNEVRFYKRAQILAGDLHAAFRGEGVGAFEDIDALTAFADYKVPQVLRQLGVLQYSSELSIRVDGFELIPAGSEQEVEIRAATIWACELIRQTLASRGVAMTASEIDWALWQAGQTASAGDRPYHRTLTGYY